MALPDLTGQNIENTYQRLLQVSSSGDIVNGTGSLFIPPSSSYAVSASYAISASHEIVKEVSSSYADTASFAQSTPLTSNITIIETIISSDSAVNVDSFLTSSYNGVVYDYTLISSGVGARTGQFMVIQDSNNLDFTDISTQTIGSETEDPEITAAINGANLEVKVTNGNGYTFKSISKKI